MKDVRQIMKLNEDQIKIFNALSREHAAKILVSIVEHNARSPSQLAIEFKLQPVQVHRVLEELGNAGLITKQVEQTQAKIGPWAFYRPTAKGLEAARLMYKK